MGTKARTLVLAALWGLLPASAGCTTARAQEEVADQNDQGEATEGGAAPEGEAARGAEHAGGEAGHHGHFNFANFSDPETKPFVANLVNFAILLAILYFLGRKPLAAFLTSRRREIAEDLEESRRLKEQAEAKHRLYQERLAHLDRELSKLRAEIVAAGEKERDRIVGDAEQTASRMRKDAEFLVEQEFKQLRIDLRRDLAELAVKAAEKVLRERVTPDDQRRLADEYARLADKLLTSSSAQARFTMLPPPGGPS